MFPLEIPKNSPVPFLKGISVGAGGGKKEGRNERGRKGREEWIGREKRGKIRKKRREKERRNKGKEGRTRGKKRRKEKM